MSHLNFERAWQGRGVSGKGGKEGRGSKTLLTTYIVYTEGYASCTFNSIFITYVRASLLVDLRVELWSPVPNKIRRTFVEASVLPWGQIKTCKLYLYICYLFFPGSV